jgi:hypothetical protein
VQLRPEDAMVEAMLKGWRAPWLPEKLRKLAGKARLEP